MDKLRSIEILTIEKCFELKPLFDNGLGVITMQKSIDHNQLNLIDIAWYWSITFKPLPQRQTRTSDRRDRLKQQKSLAALTATQETLAKQGDRHY